MHWCSALRWMACSNTRFFWVSCDFRTGILCIQKLTHSVHLFPAWLLLFIDRSTPQTLYRWNFTLFAAILFITRIYFAEAYYIVTYALGIYLLNLFLAFLQPKFDPSLEQDLAEQDVEEGAPGLPTSNTPTPKGSGRGDKEEEEFRPFIRRLPEFQFWLSATKAILVSSVATLFP